MKKVWLCENEQARWFEFEEPHDMPSEVTVTMLTETEQPAQQEPVAWCIYCDGQFTHNICHSEDLANFRAAALEEEYPRYKRTVVPLYTAPPQRTWVGLTDEERAVIVEVNTFDDHGYDIWCSGDWVARAVEAKLKEKNT